MNWTRQRIPSTWLYIGMLLLPIVAWGISWLNLTYGKYRIRNRELVQAWKSGQITTVLDVRTTTEWNQGNFPDAVHVPIQDIDASHPVVQALHQEIKRQRRENGENHGCILVYCRTGTRANYAVTKLRTLFPENTCIVYTTLPYQELETLLLGSSSV